MAPEFEQAEDFFVGQVKPQLFQGREGQGNQDFNNEPEHGGIDQSSGQAGQARTRRGRMALFSREHFDEQNASHCADDGADHRNGHGSFFQLPEMVRLMLHLLGESVGLIDDVQPGSGYLHQEFELFLRAICRHDKSVLSSSAVAGAMGVTRMRLNMASAMAATRMWNPAVTASPAMMFQ